MAVSVLLQPSLVAANVKLPSYRSTEGYLCKLLLNEVAFPGEHGYISEQDTMRAMDNILLVLDARIHFIPSPYTRYQVAQTSSEKLLDIITAGGKHGQVAGFYRNRFGRPISEPRVEQRIDYLLRIANDGKPGRFARLMNYAVQRSKDYVKRLKRPQNLYAHLRWVAKTPVTGRAYSWMTDRHYYHSGGNYVRIPNNLRGSLSGNRFFTLRDLKR
ncbi:hypothetical protein Caka_2637 [Coraliomargarita akajimensis DSM 45221]|uniref:Uncharacterized protein n=2 Tax=Coraliomargarita TaxID=442430 RepID=D5EPS0_CORAD|nr:hypothetical protein Caka_2637 [Coraliomargarita akajimensis DSM 45221]